MTMMKVLALLLALPTLSYAGVVCCWDQDCAACGDGAPGSNGVLVEKDVCMGGVFGSFLLWHPGAQEMVCMKTNNPKLYDCCTGFDPFYVNDGNPACPGNYCACEDCEIRQTMAACQANPAVGYVAEYYGENPTCKSIAAFIEGDPHVKTWAGKWFDYHGECDLVMMHVDQYEDKGAFSVHVRTKIRADYSYITSAVLRVGDETLEVSSWGDYAINGIGGGIPASRESEASLGSIGGYEIKHSHPNDKQHTFRIDLGVDESFELATFKDLVSVRANGASAEHFGKTLGLMGDFAGRKVGRDGKARFDDNDTAFGQEWQVQPEDGMLFVTEPALGKCKLPSVSTEEARRLGKGVSKDAAEKACGKYQGSGFDACVLDVQLTGDVGIASAGGY